jgi:hypothetical protein
LATALLGSVASLAWQTLTLESFSLRFSSWRSCGFWKEYSGELWKFEREKGEGRWQLLSGFVVRLGFCSR